MNIIFASRFICSVYDQYKISRKKDLPQLHFFPHGRRNCHENVVLTRYVAFGKRYKFYNRGSLLSKIFLFLDLFVHTTNSAVLTLNIASQYFAENFKRFEIVNLKLSFTSIDFEQMQRHACRNQVLQLLSSYDSYIKKT